MKPTFSRAAAALALALAISPGVRASEPEAIERIDMMTDARARPVPVVSAWLLGGQDVAAKNGRDSGIGSARAAVSFPVSSYWKVTPIYQGYFQATRQVLDAGGGGVTLFQSRMDHRLGAKVFYEPSETWRLKFNAGSRFQLLKETNDEKWGKGLFDFRKLSGGVEWEYFYSKPHSFRFGYDYFNVAFPNYYTLESRGALRVNGQPVARELVGGRVLDSDSHSLITGINGSVFRPDWVWDLSYIGALQRYPDQPVSNAAGQFDAGKRRDVLHELTASLRGWFKPEWPEKLFVSVRTTLSDSKSNQNNYNAADARFFPRYYDVRTLDVLPSAGFYFSNPLEPTRAIQLSGSYEMIFAKYPGRLVQDLAGNYGKPGLTTTTYAAVVTLIWPMRRRLSVMASYRDTTLRSNMKYEALYRYNFQSRSYLVGFGYEL
ncbi:MAG: hypothetical protein HY925_06995 [Elusimicrobia bacterium]|nr:hypothetical protein [Elusimicrobiota bacterium]